MSFFSRLTLLGLLLLWLTTPQLSLAVDSTGGKCSCEITRTNVFGEEREESTTNSTVELGESYTTTDETSCTAACSTYASNESGSGVTVTVRESSYTYPSEVEARAAALEEASKKARYYLRPNLNVSIPGLTFSDILNENGVLKINFLPEYLNGLYRYALGAAAILAVIMIMIGGTQYIVGSGLGSVEAGKKRITNAVTGLIMVLAAYTMLYLVNPNLTTFTAVEVQMVAAINANLDTDGDEGTTSGASGSNCEEAISLAQASSEDCPLSQGLLAPTSTNPNATDYISCNYHFKNAGYDYTKLTSGLDYIGTWGDSIYAMGSGTVRFNEGNGDNRCGNNVGIELDGGGVVYICHIKAFNTAVTSGSHVNQGDLIAYIGGRCCKGQEPPTTWKANAGGWCKFAGTECPSPFAGNSTCDCQEYEDSGNTTGPHAHASLYGAGGGRISQLPCLGTESAELEEGGESESSECVETTDASGETVCESE